MLQSNLLTVTSPLSLKKKLTLFKKQSKASSFFFSAVAFNLLYLLPFSFAACSWALILSKIESILGVQLSITFCRSRCSLGNHVVHLAITLFTWQSLGVHLAITLFTWQSWCSLLGYHLEITFPFTWCSLGNHVVVHLIITSSFTWLSFTWQSRRSLALHLAIALLFTW